MPTILECAKMSNAVYDNSPAVPGWTRIGFKGSGDGLTEAFQGVAFKKGGEIVFAFKGTSQKRDVVADVKLAIGMNSSQYGEAGDFVEDLQISGEVVYLTGHSLGGAIAQVVGNRQKLPFTTFNAPGVGVASRNLDQMAATVVTGSAGLRILGSVTSTIFHPVQAFQDVKTVGRTVRGVNFRVGKDVVGSVGVHFGNVIELRYDGSGLDVLKKHKMETVIAAVESNGYAGTQVDTLVD